MTHPNHGPVKSPPPAHPVASDEMAELMGGPRKGDVVFYVYQPGEEWVCMVVQVKENSHLDLVCFRPDGNTVRYWNVPPSNGVLLGTYWKPRS